VIREKERRKSIIDGREERRRGASDEKIN